MFDSGFTAYLFRYMLQNHVHTKRRMAGAVGITYRTLVYNVQRLGQEEGANVAFTQVIACGLENKISIDRIYDEYRAWQEQD